MYTSMETKLQIIARNNVVHACNINNCLMYIKFLVWHSVNELLKIKDDLTKERDEKLSDIAKVRK